MTSNLAPGVIDSMTSGLDCDEYGTTFCHDECRAKETCPFIDTEEMSFEDKIHTEINRCELLIKMTTNGQTQMNLRIKSNTLYWVLGILPHEGEK